LEDVGQLAQRVPDRTELGRIDGTERLDVDRAARMPGVCHLVAGAPEAA
jgi:hypothetical protein